MKPKEFDDLIRQKFDQNDFAYNPRNWDRLAEQMDGRAKKRSALMWWLMPLAGVAASVALAMGVSPVMKQSAPQNTISEVAHARTMHKSSHAARAITVSPSASALQNTGAPAVAAAHSRPAKPASETQENDNDVHISLLNAIPSNIKKSPVNIDLAQVKETTPAKKTSKKIEEPEYASTFKPEAEQTVSKTSIILNGGYNSGIQGTGYVAGATIRRMVSDRFYVESDVAYANSNNVQTNGYKSVSVVPNPSYNPGSRIAAKTSDGSANSQNPAFIVQYGNPESRSVSYDMSYAQVSPSLGYKLSKKLSIGAGPDMQQALSDKRPPVETTSSSVQSYGTQLQNPLFDIGLMGKSEYSVTHKLRAGVYYRKGINGVFSPDKYTERDYLQFQLKYIIFNK